MSDSTVYAEALIAAVARAFYEDEAVCLIDVLLRDKFLRDDDMGPRLSLPAKQLRRTMQHLQEEHLVKYELVDDLSSGGSQATKFWYVDYNHAVNVIRLRVYLLKKKLEEAELRARSSSMYLCPGYAKKLCNGRYTETEAQQVVDQDTGLFLCMECVQTHANNPDPPPVETYTLQLVDNTKDLRAAMDNMRRLNVQLSTKMVGNQQLRVGIYDLLQKVRQSCRASGPLSSNLPSENRALGVGSKRLAGTGRTAGIKRKKEALLMGDGAGGAHGGGGGGRRKSDDLDSDLTFLKNARGEEIAFVVERGGGTKADLLARGRAGRRMSGKLVDAAGKFSRRMGDDADIRRRERERARAERAKREASRLAADGPDFLRNNIGKTDRELGILRKKAMLDHDDDEDEEDTDDDEDMHVSPAAGAQADMTEEERHAVFHSQYLVEVARQKSLLNGSSSSSAKGTGNGVGDDALRVVSEDNGHDVEDEGDIDWEEG